MKPKTRAILKALMCYWFASICMTAAFGFFDEGHAHVALSNSPVVMVLYAPFVAGFLVPLYVFGGGDPRNWPEVARLLWSFWLPLGIALSIAFKRPERWYRFWTGN